MFDVIVVGGGPAGSTCARGCARQGFKVLLIEKKRFPREKPCAGGVSEQALSHLDFSLPLELIDKECYGMRICFKGFSIEAVKDYRLAVLVSREKFDFFLLNKAAESGVEILQEERVIDLRFNKSFVEVITTSTSYKASCVIGADGTGSRVAEFVRPPMPKNEMHLALVCRVPASNEIIDRRLAGKIELHFGMVKFGYGWIFPHDGYFSVGIGTVLPEFKNPRKMMSEFGNSIGLKIDHTSAHFIPLGGIKRRIVSDRVLLVGDAAGFADPFTGEGIVYAILSGKLAAKTVGRAIFKKDFSHSRLSSYEEDCKTHITGDLKRLWYLTRLFHDFPNVFLKLLATNEKLLGKCLEVPACRTSYKELLPWIAARLPFWSVATLFKSAAGQ